MHLLKGGRVNTIAGSRKLENRAHPKATFYQSFQYKKKCHGPNSASILSFHEQSELVLDSQTTVKDELILRYPKVDI